MTHEIFIKDTHRGLLYQDGVNARLYINFNTLAKPEPADKD
jgi:hypothetical protein